MVRMMRPEVMVFSAWQRACSPGLQPWVSSGKWHITRRALAPGLLFSRSDSNANARPSVRRTTLAQQRDVGGGVAAIFAEFFAKAIGQQPVLDPHADLGARDK